MLKIPVEINPLGTLNLLELLSIKGCSKYAKIKAIINGAKVSETAYIIAEKAKNVKLQKTNLFIDCYLELKYVSRHRINHNY